MTPLAARRHRTVLRWVVLAATIAMPPGLTIVGIAALLAVTLGWERGWAGARTATVFVVVAVAGTVILYAGL